MKDVQDDLICMGRVFLLSFTQPTDLYCCLLLGLLNLVKPIFIPFTVVQEDIKTKMYIIVVRIMSRNNLIEFFLNFIGVLRRWCISPSLTEHNIIGSSDFGLHWTQKYH